MDIRNFMELKRICTTLTNQELPQKQDFLLTLYELCSSENQAPLGASFYKPIGGTCTYR